MLRYLISVGRTNHEDNIELSVVTTYAYESILKASNSILSICRERPIRRKACDNHPKLSTEDIIDIIDLNERKPAGIELPMFAPPSTHLHAPFQF